MPLTIPIPSKSLRQASELGRQLFEQIHELQELAEGSDIEEQLTENIAQAHDTLNVLMGTLNNELLRWQMVALTAANHASGIVRFGHRPDPIFTGYLHGSILVRAGGDVEPFTREQVLDMETWWPVHRPK